MLSAVGKSQMPSLAGLIQPEKMGLLTDNRCTVRDNETHVLSDLEADVDLLTDNEADVISGLSILSGISVDVQITISDRSGRGQRRAATAATKRRADAAERVRTKASGDQKRAKARAGRDKRKSRRTSQPAARRARRQQETGR
jgi:hypothetical protein